MYYRYSRIVELTGNEQTFGFFNRGDFFLQDKVNSVFSIDFNGEFQLNARHQKKSRWSGDMSRPVFEINKLYLNINVYDYNTFKLGLDNSLMYDYPLLSVINGDFYKYSKGGESNGQKVFSPLPLLKGNKDAPIFYAGFIANQVTQVSYWLNYKGLMLAGAVSSDQKELSSLTTFTYSAKIGYEIKNVKLGYAWLMSTTGSVPVKESILIHKLFVFGGDDIPKIGGNWSIGTEWFLFQRGLRSSFTRNMGIDSGSGQADNFYQEYPFDEFTYPQQKNEETPWGYSGYVYFSLHDLCQRWRSDFVFSLFDNNYKKENEGATFKNISTQQDFTYHGMFKRKYRFSLQSKVRLFDEIYASFSFVYTIDPVFNEYPKVGSNPLYVPYFFTEWWERKARKRSNWDILLYLSYEI